MPSPRDDRHVLATVYYTESTKFKTQGFKSIHVSNQFMEAMGINLWGQVAHGY